MVEGPTGSEGPSTAFHAVMSRSPRPRRGCGLRGKPHLLIPIAFGDREDLNVETGTDSGSPAGRYLPLNATNRWHDERGELERAEPGCPGS